MKIIELRSENVKRLKAVHIKPDGAVIQITGRNGQGKSSVLDSIALACAGVAVHPTKPIRNGANRAKVTLDLGDIKVERIWQKSGNTYLRIEAADGSKISSPQKALDALTGRLSFDPLAFARMDARKQAETLREVTGLDFSEHDSERKRVYEQRTQVNREVKRLEAQLAAMPEPKLVEWKDADDPPVPVDVTELGKELRRAHDQNREYDRTESHLKNVETAIAEVEKQIQGLIDKLNGLKSEQVAIIHSFGIQERCDIETIEKALKEAETINERIRQHEYALAEYARQMEARTTVSTQLDEVFNMAAELTLRIDTLDDQKATRIAQATTPVPGLAFDGDRISLGGVPFEQISSSEQLQASVAMGLALNPKLRVMLIREGSCLDSNGLAIIHAMAEKADAQIWLERVTDGDPIGIVIEDGLVSNE